MDRFEAWRATHHAAVHRVLAAQAFSGERPPAKGTDGEILRAQSHYDTLGKAEVVSLLERMNVVVFRLRQALLAGDEADYRAQKDALAGMAEEWLYHAPLHQIEALMPVEGEA